MSTFGADMGDRNPSARLGRPATLHELTRIILVRRERFELSPVGILNPLPLPIGLPARLFGGERRIRTLTELADLRVTAAYPT